MDKSWIVKEQILKRLLKEKFSRGERLIGAILTLPSTEVAEILCQSGFDWLFLDIEHGVMDIRQAQLILQAVAPATPCLVRVPTNDEVWIKKSLDIGAAGIIIPQIKTADDAQRAVGFCKYPPEGERSVGIARAHHYGDKFQAYIDSANSETAVVIQIEHIDAVENIDEIAAVSGIDCLFVGPYDLSASMGKTGFIDDRDVQQAIARVKHCADKAGIPLGIFGGTAAAVNRYKQSGYCLMAACIDTMLLGHAAKDLLASVK